MTDDSEEMQAWICQLCTEFVNDEDPQITIAANVIMVRDDQLHELGGGEEMIFAIFHSKCVVDTMDMEHCDDVPYVWEARDLLKASVLCDECHALVSDDDPPKPEPKKRPNHLTVIKGGE